MLLSALLLHNVLPGPMLAEDRPEFIPMMSAILFLAAIAVLVCGLFLSKLTVQALRAPVGVLMPAVGLFSVIGAYALDSSMFNVFYMLGFGIGIILGPMADQNIRLALTANQGDLTPFVTRPIALILLGLIAYSLFKRKR
jgi:putative tricarboxylic transport membrane protein